MANTRFFVGFPSYRGEKAFRGQSTDPQNAGDSQVFIQSEKRATKAACQKLIWPLTNHGTR